MAAVSLIVAAILAAAVNVKRTPAEAVSELTGGTSVKQLCIVLLGTGISSVIFTLLGIIAATKIVSLNQFILWTVPIEAVCFIPAVLHLFRITPVWLRYYPVNVCMEMISGSAPPVIGIIIVMVLIAILFVFSKGCVLKMWRSMGGVKI